VLEADRPLVRPLLIALVTVMQVARGRDRGAGAAGAEGGEQAHAYHPSTEALRPPVFPGE